VKSNDSQLSLTRVHCTLPAAKCLEFAPDGSSLVIVTHEGVVQLVALDDAASPQLLRAIDLPSSGYSLLYTPGFAFLKFDDCLEIARSVLKVLQN